jgi:hypothetical protein
MAKGFYISKSLGILGLLLAVAALCTIVALSVVYAQEKNKNAENSSTAPGQALYHLSHVPSPFCSGYFGNGGLAFCPSQILLF